MSYSRHAIRLKDAVLGLRVCYGDQDSFLMGHYWVVTNITPENVECQRCQKHGDGTYQLDDVKKVFPGEQIMEFFTDPERQPPGLVLPVPTEQQKLSIGGAHMRAHEQALTESAEEAARLRPQVDALIAAGKARITEKDKSWVVWTIHQDHYGFGFGDDLKTKDYMYDWATVEVAQQFGLRDHQKNKS